MDIIYTHSDSDSDQRVTDEEEEDQVEELRSQRPARLCFADGPEVKEFSEDGESTGTVSFGIGSSSGQPKQRDPRRQSILKKSQNDSNAQEMDSLDVDANTKKNAGGGSSVTVVGEKASSDKPEWFQELTDNQIQMFKEVFELLDSDGGGTIDAGELFTLMKNLDVDISKSEIEDVLADLDSDGNGEIDFDEFLFAMANPARNICLGEGEDKERESASYSLRQRLLFTAITKFAIKNSMGEIERYYATKMRQAPHVISFYTAGARLIGLNDYQLERQMRRMQKAAKDQTSPYAKPLPFITVTRRKKKTPKAPKATPVHVEEQPVAVAPPPPPPEIEVRKSDSDLSHPPEQPDPKVMYVRRRSALLPDSTELNDLMTLLHSLAEQGSVVAKLPDVHLVPAIRNKLMNEGGAAEPICSSIRKRRRTLDGSKPGDNHHENGHRHAHSEGTKHKGKNKLKPRGWTIPRIERTQVPLPVIQLRGHKKSAKDNYTVEDVPIIRERVSHALEDYYSKLKKAHVRTSWDHWDDLLGNSIQSEKLRENFRQVYCAYSPHKEEDVFVIAPWIPGPRYTMFRSFNKNQNPLGCSRPDSSWGTNSSWSLNKTSGKSSRPTSTTTRLGHCHTASPRPPSRGEVCTPTGTRPQSVQGF